MTARWLARRRGALPGFIALVHVAIVVGIGSLVAVLFEPVRRRLTSWADRSVPGRRATPHDVPSALSRITIGTPDESSLASIARLLADGTGAEPATVWLRVGDRLLPAASVPDRPPLAAVPVTDEALPDLPGDLVAPVIHEGQLLGALTIIKPRGEQVTSEDADSVTRSAADVGLAMRNVRLTAELRARLRELEVSRHRIVAAQDEARRTLSRDLQDGAQRRLALLEERLGAVQREAEAAGAPKTADLLRQIAGDAESAAATLHELARGIYPSLLESGGLGAALEAHARTSTVPLTVHVSGVGRHPAEIEVAVYFCVLEALHNVAEFARASSAHVRLTLIDGDLCFTVADDGEGFDVTATQAGTGIAGMADRLDTIGGTLDIRSRPGQGTVVAGRVPARTEAPAVTEVGA